MRFFKHLLNTDTRKTLVTSLIFPHFDYCTFAIGNLYDYQFKSLQKLMNAAVRFVFDIPFPQKTSPKRLSLGWLSIKLRYQYLGACVIHKYLETSKPPYFCDKIIKNPFPRQQRSSHRILIPISSKSSEHYQSAFIESVSFYNSLPLNITRANSFNSFKSLLHSYLLKIDKSDHINR